MPRVVCSSTRATCCRAMLAPFRALSYSWEMHVQRELTEATRAPRVPAGDDPAARRTRKRRCERSGAARSAKLPGFLLADDVGLGKTISAWAAILEMKDVESVLVVCPLSVVAHWRRTIEAMGDGGKDIVVLNYDRLGKLFEVSDAARKKIRTKKGLARAGTAPELDLIVFDESHRCKNPTAARSKLAAKLVANAGLLSVAVGDGRAEPARAVVSRAAARERDRARRQRTSRTSSSGASIRTSASRAAPTASGSGAANARIARRCERCCSTRRDGLPAAGIRRRPEDIVGLARDQPDPDADRARRPTRARSTRKRGPRSAARWSSRRAGAIRRAPSRRRCGCARRAR